MAKGSAKKAKGAPANQVSKMFDFDGMSDEQIGQASSEEEEEYQASNRRKFTNSAKKESKP